MSKMLSEITFYVKTWPRSKKGYQWIKLSIWRETLVYESWRLILDNQIYKQFWDTHVLITVSDHIRSSYVDLEERALEILNLDTFLCQICRRYYHAMAVSPLISDTLRVFNDYHPRLQFTVEIGRNQLNFLHVTIIKANNFLEFNWYHKPTFSSKYLRFFVSTPFLPKKRYHYGDDRQSNSLFTFKIPPWGFKFNYWGSA